MNTRGLLSQSSQQLQQQQQQQSHRTVRDLPGMESAANALLDAVNRSKRHLVKFILEACEKDVEVVTNYRDFKGKTPLIRAVYITEEKCRQKILDMLLTHGADPNYQDDKGRTALSYACELRHNDVVRLLVRYNVDPELPDVEGNTPLMHCARVGNDSGIGILIKCFRRLGLDIDRANKVGFTAMLIAARHGFTECASLLALDGHASITRTDPQYGRNAEQWARAQGCSTPEVAPFSPGISAGTLGGSTSGGQSASGITNNSRHRLMVRGPRRDDPTAVYPSPCKRSGGSHHHSLSTSMPTAALAEKLLDEDSRNVEEEEEISEEEGSSVSEGDEDELAGSAEDSCGGGESPLRDECSPPPQRATMRDRGSDGRESNRSAGTSVTNLD